MHLNEISLRYRNTTTLINLMSVKTRVSLSDCFEQVASPAALRAECFFRGHLQLGALLQTLNKPRITYSDSWLHLELFRTHGKMTVECSSV